MDSTGPAAHVYTIDMKQVMLYAVGGGTAALVDIGVLFLCVEFFGFHYLAGLVIAFLFAVSVNFMFQRSITFSSRSGKIAKQFLHFIGVALFGLAVQAFVMYIGVEFFDLWYMFVKIIAILVAFLWNYTVNKRVTFSPEFTP